MLLQSPFWEGGRLPCALPHWLSLSLGSVLLFPFFLASLPGGFAELHSCDWEPLLALDPTFPITDVCWEVLK